MRRVRSVLALALWLASASSGFGQEAPGAPPRILGQVPQDYEIHGDLILVSGQLAGFAEACGFGRVPDREELFRWYDYHQLARNMLKIRAIFDLGLGIGRDGPCTVERNLALVRSWEDHLNRTRAYVERYR